MQTTKLLPVFTILISLLLLQSPNSAQTNARRSVQNTGGTIIFALEKYAEEPTIQMEPIVILNGGKYTAPPVDAEPAVTKKFTDTYFRPGRRYRVVFGGGDAGSLTVKKEIEPGCVGLSAEVIVQTTTARLGGQVQALAVSSDNIGRGEGSRRAPTEDERAAAAEVARAVYGQRAVPAALVKNMKIVNLTATDLERDGKFELIGNFEIHGKNEMAYNLFIIFDAIAAGKYKAAWTWYHKGAEEMYEDRRLVDVIDLDGDDTAEVIAEGHYYESNDYVIYKRRAGTWRPVYRGGGGGC